MLLFGTPLSWRPSQEGPASSTRKKQETTCAVPRLKGSLALVYDGAGELVPQKHGEIFDGHASITG